MKLGFVRQAIVVCSLATCIGVSNADTVTVNGFGAMGASETQGTSYRNSWVPYLSNLRGLNFGGSGNPYNVAVGGATTSSLLSQQQHIKTRNNVAAGNVDVAVLTIGTNDYFDQAINIVTGVLSGPALETYTNDLVDRMFLAVDTVLTADPVGLAVCGIPDVLQSPTGQALAGSPVTIERIQTALELVNSRIEAETLARGLVYIDLESATHDILSSPLVIGGVTINTTSSSSNPIYFFQDAVHPGAVGNGLIANIALTALNTAYGQDYALLTDQDILTAAGLGASYSGETLSINYSQYVVTSVPEASSFAMLLLLAGGALSVRVWRVEKVRTACVPYGAGDLHFRNLP